LLNIAYFIDQKGDILGKYVKKNLWCELMTIPNIHEASRLI